MPQSRSDLRFHPMYWRGRIKSSSKNRHKAVGKALVKKNMEKKVLLIALAILFLASAHPADAQQPAKVPRIGVLWPDSAPSPRIEEFREGLHDLGYVEGQNIFIEYRYADG